MADLTSSGLKFGVLSLRPGLSAFIFPSSGLGMAMGHGPRFRRHARPWLRHTVPVSVSGGADAAGSLAFCASSGLGAATGAGASAATAGALEAGPPPYP